MRYHTSKHFWAGKVAKNKSNSALHRLQVQLPASVSSMCRYIPCSGNTVYGVRRKVQGTVVTRPFTSWPFCEGQGLVAHPDIKTLCALRALAAGRPAEARQVHCSGGDQHG